MAQINKGKLLLHACIQTLIVGAQELPLVGLPLKLGAAFRDAWVAKLKAAQDEIPEAERPAQLEQAAAIEPAQARVLAGELLDAPGRQGPPLTPAQREAVLDLAAALPAHIRGRTQATLAQAKRHGTLAHVALPVSNRAPLKDRDAFYQTLLPERRPRFRPGDPLPHGNPEWRLQELIGTGGFGEVWRAEHAYLKDAWAVKFCQDETGAAVLRKEAKNLHQLRQALPDHPNIVRLHDLQLTHDPLWLSFEYLPGGTLEALMRGRGPWPWAEALKFLTPLWQAMSQVHALNPCIVHRDLKPANILLTAQGQPKIGDFGIGKILAEQAAEEQKTLISQSLTARGYGSPGYMSPEQKAGERAHPADDTYALGIILWQMLAGSPAQFPEYPKHISALEAPQLVKDLLTVCRFSDREERPQDAAALLRWVGEANRPPVTPTATPTAPVEPSGTTWTDPATGMEFIKIPGGCFDMGSPESEKDRSSDERQHRVCVHEGGAFWMGKHAVTRGQFAQFVQATGYKTEAETGDGAYGWTGSEWKKDAKYNWRTPGFAQTDSHPVTCVSWNDAMAFIQWLNKQNGKSYRLPTEAEWEYACRAGTTTPFHTGTCISTDQANYDGNHPYQNCPKGQYRKGTVAVGSLNTPNKFGLHDMHGNVWEWTCSAYDEKYGGGELVCAESAGIYVLRGGSWLSNAQNLRSADRSWSSPGSRYSNLGFRVALPLRPGL